MKLRNITQTIEARYSRWLFKTKSGKKWQRTSRMDKFACKLVVLNLICLSVLFILSLSLNN